MKSKQFRILTENGMKYTFNSDALANILYKKKASDKSSLEELYGKIADATGYSTDAVKKWKLGCNGVADVETVKILADVIEVDYHKLIIPVKDTEENTMTNTNEMNINVTEQSGALEVIYAAMLDYLQAFNSTWGFELDTCDDLEEMQQERKKYMKEFYKLSNVVYSMAMKINQETYKKIVILLDDLQKLVTPMEADMDTVPYIPDLWREDNKDLDVAACNWEALVEGWDMSEPEYILGTSEDIFDIYCDVLTREFINRFRSICNEYEDPFKG